MVAFVHAVCWAASVSRKRPWSDTRWAGGVAAEYAERHWRERGLGAGVGRRVGYSPSCRRRQRPRLHMAHHALLRPLLRWTLPRWLIAHGIRVGTFADPSKVGDEMIDRINDLAHYPGNRAMR